MAIRKRAEAHDLSWHNVGDNLIIRSTEQMQELQHATRWTLVWVGMKTLQDDRKIAEIVNSLPKL